MTIEFKNPGDVQRELMQQFGDCIEKAIKHTMQHDANRMIKVHEKLQEAMHWYQTTILGMDFSEQEAPSE